MRCEALAILLSCSLTPAQVQTTLEASKDNTLYQDAAGALSNGSGQAMFAGMNSAGNVRRALLQFDVASRLPPGSRIVAAMLTLQMTQGGGPAPVPVALHAVAAAWGEGSSAAPGSEGAGAPAAPGDATWLHTFFSTSLWSTAGGDFAAAASAVTPIGGAGAWSWSSAQLAAEVQAWLDRPATSFGWVVRGDESNAGTAMRFGSRQNLTPSLRPRLTVTYVPPASVTTVGAPCQGFTLAANGLPQVGNAAFALQLSGGIASSFGLVALTPALLPAPLPFGNGCLLHVDLAALLAVLGVPLDPAGAGVLGIPIPGDPTLHGAVVHSQALDVDLVQLGNLVGANALTLRPGQ
jgi:hypothetical protein